MKKAAAHHEWSPLKLVMKYIFKNMILFICVLSDFDIIYAIRYDVAYDKAVKMQKSVHVTQDHRKQDERHRFL